MDKFTALNDIQNILFFYEGKNNVPENYYLEVVKKNVKREMAATSQQTFCFKMRVNRFIVIIKFPKPFTINIVARCHFQCIEKHLMVQ